MSTEIWDYIHREYMAKRQTTMDVRDHRKQAVHERDLEECKDELTGCVRFISALSRVDGLVIMDTDLVVRGFGVEITTQTEPESVWIAGNAQASPAKLRRIGINHFGMRHRSMMRYCYAYPGSIGFVISQDGDIRAITMVQDKLVMWENVQVRLSFSS